MKNRDGFCMKYDITNIYEILCRRKISQKKNYSSELYAYFSFFWTILSYIKNQRVFKAHGKDILMKTYFSLKGILNPVVNTERQPRTPRDMLLDDIRKTQCALEIAYSGFDNVTDPDLIDCYIYEVNSALKRYRFLLQQAEQMQLYEEYHMDSPECYENKSLVEQPIT